MAAVGKITETQVGDDMVYTDESGASYTLPGYAVKRGIGIELDPRIDLTKPIYEQAAKLDAKDKAAARKRQTAAA
jgi:hypothetical protein